MRTDERTTPEANDARLACSLETAGFRARLGEWRALNQDALLRHEPRPLGLTAFYRAGDDVAERLASLVAAERECCPFLDFRLAHGKSEIRVEVEGAPGFEGVLEALAGDGEERRAGRAGRFFVRQFGHPSGLLGRFAGRVMARMNVEVNTWVVDLLDVGPNDRFLDVGCGPGLAVEVAASRGARLAAGVDPSDVVVRQARRRNGVAIAAGRAAIEQAGVEALPYPDAFFTKTAAVNALPFWDDRAAGLRELGRVLAPAGRVALVLRVRKANAGRFDRASHGATREQVERFAAAVVAAGFEEVEVRFDEVRGETMAVIVARKPDGPSFHPTATGGSGERGAE